MQKVSLQLKEDLFIAYYDARRNKRNNQDVLAFEMDYERKLFTLYDDIMSRQYQVSPSTAFIITRPVRREIFAGAFRDRVVHHLLFNYLGPIFERLFVNDCYSCRKGRGTMYGIRRLDHFIRSCSENYSRDCWLLKFDISGYFMSIDRTLLYRQVNDTVTRHQAELAGDWETIRYLLKKTIFHNPIKDCIVKGSSADWRGLPRNKSLFYSGEGRGLPIGNITSQLFGNVYLLDFDNFMKRVLGSRYYGRYVDDCVAVHRDKNFLLAALEAARQYLPAHLKLEVHPLKVYLQPVSRGGKFLGVFLKPHRIYIANRTKGKFYAALRRWGRLLVVDHGNEQIQKLVAVLNSYLGLMGHWNTWRLRRRMVTSQFPALVRQFITVARDYGAVRSRGRVVEAPIHLT